MLQLNLYFKSAKTLALNLQLTLKALAQIASLLTRRKARSNLPPVTKGRL